MLGRADYTKEELDRATAIVEDQLAAYQRLAAAVEATGDDDARAALDAFEPLLGNSLTLALDRFFVHRVRKVTGKKGTPLNEAELLVESLMGNGGVLRTNNVLEYTPGESVVGLEAGDDIALRAEQFERLSQAVLAEIDEKFVSVPAA